MSSDIQFGYSSALNVFRSEECQSNIFDAFEATVLAEGVAGKCGEEVWRGSVEGWCGEGAVSGPGFLVAC